LRIWWIKNKADLSSRERSASHVATVSNRRYYMKHIYDVASDTLDPQFFVDRTIRGLLSCQPAA